MQVFLIVCIVNEETTKSIVIYEMLTYKCVAAIPLLRGPVHIIVVDVTGPIDDDIMSMLSESCMGCCCL